MRIHWDYDDEYNFTNDDAGHPETFFLNKKKAEEYATKLNLNAIRGVCDNLSSYMGHEPVECLSIPLDDFKILIESMGGSVDDDNMVDVPNLDDVNAKRLLAATTIRWYHVVPMEINDG
jgi:hypothetical protein